MHRFHDLAWTAPTKEHPRGIIAGALDNGSLGLWDAEKLITDPQNASIFNQKIHSGAIKTLQFNPKIPNFLASGGAKGELFITDLDNLGSPIRLGSTAARADDIDCLDWNKKVPNILVTGSSGGFVTVWDLKTKKESLTLNNYGRKPVSAVAWDPEKPTRLITAVPLEQEPVILVWDLRNSNAPEKILKGHDSGVLSLSWCPQDSDLLLSCGKDNRTILWNPQSGQAYGDYPVVTNWTFQTRWNPKNPSMFATASFDGKLSIQTLQNTNPEATSQDQAQAADGEDFFSKAQTQPQASSFSLAKAPKWLERPASVSFGFGGRLISVKPVEAGKRVSKISINKFEVDSNVGSATDTFERAIESGSLEELCKSRAAEAKSDEEKADWRVMETLLLANPRKELVSYLGFGDADDAADNLAKLGLSEKTAETTEAEKPQVNGAPSKGHRRFESVFANSADGDFLSQLAATQGTKTNNPFELYTGSESEADKKITKAVMLGEFEKALDIALSEERMSDAFMLAICGGEKCIKKAQEAYFAKQSGGPNYLRLLASIVGKNLWDTVHNASLKNWKEVMAALCTFADEKEFPDLCEALGDRLEEEIATSPSARKDAAFCYLAGSKLEKVIAIWIQELKEHEEASVSAQTDGSAFSLHARGLQELIEKVTIFRKVVNFQDNELSKPSDWKLDALYNKYLEYADIVAAHGQLAAAQKYLDLLPLQYPEADVARSRIQQATKKPGAVQQPAAASTRAATTTPISRTAPSTGSYQPTQNTFIPAGQPQAPTSLPYSVPQADPFSNPYGQAQAAPVQPRNPYAPEGYQATPAMKAPSGLPSQGYGVVPPPPRMFNQSPSVAPPSKDRNMTNWNDIPDGFVKAPKSRTSTPSIPQPGPTFTGQAPPQTMAQAQFGGGRGRASPAPPPPPKGAAGAPPRVTSPLTAPLERPASRTSNAYAPQSITSPPIGQNAMMPPIARGASPYNAPPSAAPTPNRYAPAPGAQVSNPPPTGRPAVAPPPQAQFTSPPPPANPYAPSRAQAAPSPSPYAPQQPPRQDSLSMQPPPSNNFAAPPTGIAPPPMGMGQSQRPGTAGSETQAPPPPPAVKKHRK